MIDSSFLVHPSQISCPQAEKYGQSGTEKVVLELSDAEQKIREDLRAVWNSILKIETTDDTDFFGAGAGSMNVVQLVEEVKEKAGTARDSPLYRIQSSSVLHPEGITPGYSHSGPEKVFLNRSVSE